MKAPTEAPTEAQLKDPKWWDENAPKGATHALPAAGRAYWEKWEDGNVFTYQEPVWKFHITQSGAWFGRIPRPTKPKAPEWSGEGVPPAGIQCECYYTGLSGKKQWIECDVVGPYGDYVICAPNGGGFYGFDADELRPIRTKQHRERDELTNTIKEAVRLGLNEQGISNTVWAAGWRKGDA